MDITNLWQAWPISGPWALEPITGKGANNILYIVDTPEGSRYVLRISGLHADPQLIGYEFAVTTSIQAAHLPFAIPAPIPARDGEFFVRVQDGESQKLAALLPFVPGTEPDRDSLVHAHAAGEGLGQLLDAMNRITLPVDSDSKPFASYGSIDQLHPLVPDPRAAFAALFIYDSTKTWLLDLLQHMYDAIPHLYGSLPQQITHGDYIRNNLLMVGDQLSGVLDWEFTTSDLRAMDVAVLLGSWPRLYLDTGHEWPILEALSRGIAGYVRLTPAEIEALPILMRLRNVAALIHFVGRHLQRLDAPEQYMSWIEENLTQDNWLTANGADLVQRARTWFGTD